MEFLKRIFGSEETGVKWGGVLSVLLAGAGGFALSGGWLGAVVGLGGGLLLAPMANKLFFEVGRGNGMVTPPPRNTTITPNQPTEELPAPVRQPDNSLSPTNVRAPILESMKPPPPLAIEESFKQRNLAWEILLRTTDGNMKEYDTAVAAARQLERHSETFMATIDEYHHVRDEYQKKGGKRDELVGAVKASLNRSGITNALTDDETQRFVPGLPALATEQRNHTNQLVMDALAESIEMPQGQRAFPLRQYARDKYIYEGDKLNQAKLEEWNNKTSLERLNIALNILDDERANYARIDWAAAFGGEQEAGRIRVLPRSEIITQAQRRLDSTQGTEGNDEGRRQLRRIIHATAIEEVRSRAHVHVQGKLREVVDIYTGFRQNDLVPATALAHEFANSRLSVFNETGIAILEKGPLEAAKSPDGKDCRFMTYKDCTAPAGSQEVTLVMQDDGSGKPRITHRVVGGISGTVSWAEAELKDGGIPVSREVFEELKPASGKTIGATIRGLITAAATAPMQLALADPQMRDLNHLFQMDNPAPEFRLASAEAKGIPSQPGAIGLKKKDKIENPFAKSGSEVTV